MPVCHYPQGGIAKSAGGRGIFRDAAGERIMIYVDYMLKSASPMIKAAQVGPAALLYIEADVRTKMK